MKSCEICEILPTIEPEFTIYNGQFWAANLRDQDQTLLGTTFITARRHIQEVDFQTPEERREFEIIQDAVLGAIRAAFNPITFNIADLKNDAFKLDPDNTPPEAAHLHWHIKPRYGTKPIEFAGEIFRDPLPGRYLSTFERHKPRVETAVAIAAAIKANIRI